MSDMFLHGGLRSSKGGTYPSGALNDATSQAPKPTLNIRLDL